MNKPTRTYTLIIGALCDIADRQHVYVPMSQDPAYYSPETSAAYERMTEAQYEARFSHMVASTDQVTQVTP